MVELLCGFALVSLLHFGVSEMFERSTCTNFRFVLTVVDFCAILGMGAYTVLILEEFFK